MKAKTRIACVATLAITIGCAGAQTASAQVTCTGTGGGRVETPSGNETTFGLAVVLPGMTGHQTYRDDTIEPGFTFHSETITSVTCVPSGFGKVADMQGTGRVVTHRSDGEESEEDVIYRIRAQDRGEPGSAIQGLDLYSIFLSNGYTRSEQPVIFGNIRVDFAGL